ncbi:Glycosyl hydrolases family 31 protein [Trichomonas vaginalis G3]|uniref:Glucosidase II subunit alpha n=1 Tax=Trichomonas vaginalis (strain ATCC PRA-98 / G3) TaxID=412133 RepID=A2DBB0_TRIV3|nr:glycosyl hydrolase [Trichomonas vaginalis G3]EAY22440.1 Glycosyl hydrolases family 31 protein [Trichomonas vaginalis G3]KAI5517601.1 alpha-glucosidase family [Trichomonas vaginalis G3]|eukprot:XP_001583426.1 glycosyl hydrolase [Trichomonas vaginalis G3]
MFSFLFFLFSSVLCVDEGKYRQCDQSPFCHRNRETDKQFWSIIDKEIDYNKNYFQCLIQDDSADKQLVLFVYFLQTGIRFRIEPSETERFKRYDAAREPSIINKTELNITKPYSHSTNHTHIFLNQGDQSITISIKPFTATLTTTKGRVLVINPDDTAIFEHNRDRNKNPTLFHAADFDGTIDKIPNGPTSVAMDFLFLGDNVRFHGLPEHTLNLTLPFTTHRLRRQNKITFNPVTDPIRLFNVDINRYEIGNPMAMYGSIPFLLARDSKKTTGLFWCNPSETWIDTSEERTGSFARFLSEGGYIDFFVFTGGHASEILQKYTQLTGKPPLHQGFVLGYHQSRWGYKSSKDVREVLNGLDTNIIPVDAMWLDLDHLDDKMYFTYDPYKFADFAKLQDDYDNLERKFVALCDPHLRIDMGYYIFEQAFNQHFFVKTRLDSDYEGECWPGDSSWVDFTNPWARVWWETLFEFENYKGSTLSLYIWNDMNEPAVFDVPDMTLPKDVIHHKKIENREVHNVYGHLMALATYGGLMKRDSDEDDRPFVLTRSFFAGTQKYAVTWTGDNAADWAHLRASIPMVLSLGLSGMPFCGADVGGFFDSPSENLLARWFQLGAWCYPFFREHSHHESQEREPFKIKGVHGESIRKSIADRYQMFQYWYTLARKSNKTGEPLSRPVWWEFPNDRRFADIETMFMLGPSFLVAPILEDNVYNRTIDLPFGRWYNFNSLKECERDNHEKTFVEAPITEIPVLMRGGSIVPLKNWKRRTTFLMRHDPITLVIALDQNGEASGELYDDDQQTTAFATGDYIHAKYSFTNHIIASNVRDSKMARDDFFEEYDVKVERIKVLGLKAKPKSVKAPNGNLDFDFENEVLTIHRVLQPVKRNWQITLEMPQDSSFTKSSSSSSNTQKQPKSTSEERLDL